MDQQQNITELLLQLMEKGISFSPIIKSDNLQDL